MITNENLLIERPHPLNDGSVQRIYRFKNGMGLSVINSPMLHSYPFTWEAAVVSNVGDDGKFDAIIYTTELTPDVEVFDTDEEANAFIAKAKALFD